MITDVHATLGAAIAGLFHPATPQIFSSSQRRWSSVIFTGARHRFALCLSGDGAKEAADQASAAVKGETFELDGHVVADIAITDRRTDGQGMVEVEFEALTVEAH